MIQEKISDILTKIMLAIFIFVIGFPVLSKVMDIEHKSYILAFMMAAIIFVGYILIKKKQKSFGKFFEKLGAVKTAIILSIVCFAINLGWVIYMQLEPTVDFYTFWHTATQLAEGTEIEQKAYLGLFPHILGYSTFLSVMLRIFGQSTMTAAVVNVMLTTLSGVIIFVLCLRWKNLNSAVFGFLLWTVCPSKMLYNSMVLSEPYYTFLLLCFILIVSYLEEKADNKMSWMLYGVWGIPAALLIEGINSARPIAAIPVIAFFIWLLVLRGSRLKDKSQWKKWISFAVVLLLMSGVFKNCWNIYAENIIEEELPEKPGYSIYVGFNPESMGSYSDEDMNMLLDYRYNVYGNAFDAQEKMLEEAKNRITNSNISLPALFAEKLKTLLGNDEGGVYYSKAALNNIQYSVYAMASNIFYYFIVMLAVYKAFMLIKKPEKKSLLLIPLYPIGLALAHMLVEVAGRYHYSIIPMIIIMASLQIEKKEKEI